MTFLLYFIEIIHNDIVPFSFCSKYSDNMGINIRLTEQIVQQIDGREIRARLDWFTILWMRTELTYSRPLVEHGLRCLLGAGTFLVPILYSRIFSINTRKTDK